MNDDISTRRLKAFDVAAHQRIVGELKQQLQALREQRAEQLDELREQPPSEQVEQPRKEPSGQLNGLRTQLPEPLAARVRGELATLEGALRARRQPPPKRLSVADAVDLAYLQDTFLFSVLEGDTRSIAVLLGELSGAWRAATGTEPPRADPSAPSITPTKPGELGGRGASPHTKHRRSTAGATAIMETAVGPGPVKVDGEEVAVTRFNLDHDKPILFAGDRLLDPARVEAARSPHVRVNHAGGVHVRITGAPPLERKPLDDAKEVTVVLQWVEGPDTKALVRWLEDGRMQFGVVDALHLAPIRGPRTTSTS